MANKLLSVDIIATEALIQLENNLVLANMVNRAPEADIRRQYNGNKTGGKVRIRRPVQYTVRSGATASLQDTEEGYVDLNITEQKGVDMSFQHSDLALTISQFSERYITPAMIQLANIVDSDLYSLYTRIPNWVGTPGELIDSFADFTKATVRMSDLSVPYDNRYACLDPENYNALASNFTTLAAPDRLVTRTINRGDLPVVSKVGIDEAQNVKRHTVGVATGTPLVDGAGQNVTYASVADSTPFGQDLVTDGWTNSTTGILKAGDVITIAGVKAVNPIGKETLGHDQPFVVTEDVDSGATTGPATLKISPPIITSGPQQTVSAAPADDAAITVMGTGGSTYTQNLVMRRDAMSLAMVPMELPEAGSAASSRRSRNGISVRLVSDYDFTNDIQLWRFDILYGYELTDYRQAVRLSGTA